MTTTDKKKALRRLIVDKVHVGPQALGLSSAAVQRAYPHGWKAVQELEVLLGACPKDLLWWWAHGSRGHVLLTHLSSHYAEGYHPANKRVLENLAYVCLSDLHEHHAHALRPVGSLLDHLMGSNGAPGGAWLSDGVGVIPELSAVGERVREYARLGYLDQESGPLSARDYFSVAFGMYLTNSQELNVADPRIHRLMRSTTMSEDFWKRISSSLPPSPTIGED